MSKLYIICIILFYSLFIGVKAHAQYAGAKYEKGPSPKMEILQVDNRELSTMVYRGSLVQNSSFNISGTVAKC